ncbi:hypothetical protein BGX38DRAFT_1173566 [Terfezia claveryi]|nr:hypothetical protein BGX38DRAFT_1173566 [Terfezia claveryi]
MPASGTPERQLRLRLLFSLYLVLLLCPFDFLSPCSSLAVTLKFDIRIYWIKEYLPTTHQYSWLSLTFDSDNNEIDLNLGWMQYP